MTAMAGLSLNVLTENASRLGARLQETFQEHTRDFGAKDYFDAPEEKIKAIRTQLDSNSDREKIDGLKRLVAVRLIGVCSLNTYEY
jgi:AP-3 complex subunit beta